MDRRSGLLRWCAFGWDREEYMLAWSRSEATDLGCWNGDLELQEFGMRYR